MSGDTESKRSPIPAVVAIMAGGVLLWLLVIVSGVMGARSDFSRFIVPGQAQLELASGKYTIFHEYPRTVDSVGTRKPGGVEKLACTLTEMATGALVPLTPARSTTSYKIRRVIGEPLYDFSIARSGSFRFDSSYPPAFAGAETSFAVGRSHRAQIFATFGKGLAVIATTIALIAALLLRARKRPVQSGPQS